MATAAPTCPMSGRSATWCAGARRYQRAGEIPRRREDRPSARRPHHRPVRRRADRRGGGGDGVPRLSRGHRHDLPRAPVALRGDEGRGPCGRQARAEYMRGTAAVVLAVALAGCSLQPHYYPTLKEQAIALRQGELESGGIAFITPSTVTGQEQEKQAVALAFADVLKQQRPGLKVSTLAETLSAVNRAGLADPYKRMYDDYRDTGLFSSETLRRVAQATGTRYIAQLKLQGFGQGSKGRFGLLGLRIVETLYGDVRVYLQ